ncbi:transposase [Streptomyces sp. H27-H1]|uniref:transposase n=1 Tax=Streptomyces sp. H27-H1 TaxID=2996461 RepID=UPI003B637499
MSQKRRKFSPEYREEAVKMVLETSRPVAQVARELGLVEGTLRNWVNAIPAGPCGGRAASHLGRACQAPSRNVS